MGIKMIGGKATNLPDKPIIYLRFMGLSGEGDNVLDLWIFSSETI